MVILDHGRFAWPTDGVGHGMLLVGLVNIGMAFGTTLAAQEPFVIILFCRSLVAWIRRLWLGVVSSESPEQEGGQDEESTDQPE